VGCQLIEKSRRRACVLCEESTDVSDVVAGERRPDLPDYKLSEVSQHKTAETGVWVTFGNGVYDITEFIVGHPGGDRIKLASGGALEPFWELYAIHKSSNVFSILETLRIGNIHPDDVHVYAPAAGSSNDPYGSEPLRHPALHVRTPKPFNAETPSQLLVDSFITPNELFYVRNHLPVPQFAAGSDRFELSGVGLKSPVSLSVDELKKKFTVRTVTCTMPCAGNRRSEMKGDQPVRGLQWNTGAVGNARWTGVLLSDILLSAGVKENEVAHVIFQGRDVDPEGSHYEASIPAETAFDRNKEVLIAFEMNGRPLPADHGYPLRVVVPGTIGARQVKWLSKIILSKEESESFWQKKDYKTVSPAINWDKYEGLNQVMAIQYFPVTSVICSPVEGTAVDGQRELTMKGYAMSGGGHGILRVDVTIDDGKTWHIATIQREPQPWGRQWSWVLWEAAVPLPKDLATGTKVEIAVRATDTSHNTQPETDSGIWNIRGLLENKWHRIHVQIADDNE